MTQKTARLQRWLDRLTAACDNKKWKSAVAEADCLSAELRLVREELWEKAEESAAPKRSFSFRTCASFGARSFGIAMAIVCLCTFPIAVESGKPQNIAALPTGAENKFEEFTLVTAEEKELLQMLRANLKESNVAVKKAEKSLPAKPKLAARTAERHITDIPERPAAPRAEKIRPEELLTLIQIGEKSLRGDTPAIKIIN
ncbi:hypothetical protein [Cloacibacillus sp. An23]|uniref:hypothetical protein n=1 Tax=Cloacibacillus sp. An23 TaxID=1965591 RepID=UPI000B3AE8DD|nr:hypothetical protein [Cloacibacillus sp. An23]OUO92222.1 hypothetical protein B5F39_11350 [Cloacibacillus sp. An23]